MSKVLLVLAVVATAQPAGQTFGGKYLCKVNEAAQIVDQPQATSDELPDGDYVASFQALDSNNATMGDAATVSFSLAGGQIVVPGSPVPAPPPAPDTYPAPLSISVSVVAA